MHLVSGPWEGRLKFVQLKYFLEIAETGSFTAAALKLGVAQPALSRQMKLLEQELGSTLLLRHGRGVELTEAGLLLLERATFLLRSLEETRLELMSRSATPTGTVRVGCPPSLARSVVLDPLTTFLARFSNVAVHLEEGASDSLLAAVLGDQLDLAVVTTPPPHPDLVIYPLFDEPMWLFTPPDACAPGTPFALAEVVRLPLMISRRPHGVRVELERRLAEAGLSPKFVLETNAWQVIRELILSGVGCFVASRSALEIDVRAGHLSGGPVESYTVSRGLVRRTDRPMSRAVMEFVALMTAERRPAQPT